MKEKGTGKGGQINLIPFKNSDLSMSKIHDFMTFTL